MEASKIGAVEPGEIARRFYSGNLVYQEHLSRYRFVRGFLKGKTVLEIGSGPGDGTKYLAEAAKEITAVEIDPERRSFAIENFSAPNISFAEMDARRLGFKDNRFDAVVSLEVIEHMSEHDLFVSEIRRVLNDGGLAILSTPNKDVVRLEGSTSNAAHVKELDFDEFRRLLSGKFAKVDLYGQTRGKGVSGKGRALHDFVRGIDVLGLRRIFPQGLRDSVYSGFANATGAKRIEDIQASDLVISKHEVEKSRNIIAICTK